MEVDELILAMADEEVQHEDIRGLDLWEVPKRLAEQYTCESCGKECWARPSMIGRSFTCGNGQCLNRMWRARMRGTAPDRPLWPNGRWGKERNR